MKSRSSHLLLSGLAAALLQACGGGGGGGSAAPAAGQSPLPTAPAPLPTTPAPSPAPTPTPTPTPTPSPSPSPSPSAPTPAPTARGTPLGAVAASAEIGPAGGRVDAPDYSLAVIVPPGAFDRVRTVALQPIANLAHGARGAAWRITPESLDTPQPMTIEFRYTEAQAQGARRLALATQGADGIWRSSRATQHDAAARTLRVQTRHFSDWSFVAGAQLRPGQAEVGLGQTLQLTVLDCGSAHDPADPAADQLYACSDTGGPAIGTSDWAVNGVAGGNAATGRLSGDTTIQAARRSYTAPAALPGANPVAVSVQYQAIDSQQVEALVAQVRVIDPGAGCQWLAGVTRVAAEYDSDYRWSGGDDDETQTLRHQARTRGELLRMDPSPVGQVWFEGLMRDGLVSVEHRQSSRIVPDVTEVEGSAAPLVPPGAAPLVRMWVNLQTCSVRLFGDAPVRVRRTRTQFGATFIAEGEAAGGAFVLAEQAIAGRREFVGEALLPAFGSGQGGSSSVFVVSPDFNAIEGPLGTARVRWAFRPQ